MRRAVTIALAALAWGCGDEVMGTFAERPHVVVVGEEGFRMSSYDRGQTWPVQLADAGWDDDLRDVVIGPEQILAVGGDVTSRLLRSADGTTWEELGDLEGWLGGIVDGPTGVVAVGRQGRIVAANGGLTPLASPTEFDLYAVAADASRLVAVGDGGISVVSTDGTTWAQGYQVGPTLAAIAHGAGVFVAVGDDWARVTSTDGLSVDQLITELDGPPIHDILYAEDRFLAVGDGLAYVSSDGFAWTTTELGLELLTLAFDGERYYSTDGRALYTSDDGLRWDEHLSPASYPLTAVGAAPAGP